MKKIETKLTDWYSEEMQISLCDQLMDISSILSELVQIIGTETKKSRHPIHGYADFLWEQAASRCLRVGELKYLEEELMKTTRDLVKSKNTKIRDLTNSSIMLMEKILKYAEKKGLDHGR